MTGLSISMFDRDAEGRPVPSAVADEAELEALVAVLGRRRRHLEMIPTAQERPSALRDLERIGTWCRDHDVTATWNGFLDLRQDRASAEEYVELCRRLQHDGARIYPQVSPRTFDLSVNFDQTMAFMWLPAWNEVVHSPPATKRRLLADPSWRRRASVEWDAEERWFFPVHDLDSVRITKVGRDVDASLLGTPLGAWLRSRAGHPSDGLADWLLANDLETELAYALGNDDPDRVGALCSDPTTIVSGSDAGAHVRMFCASGDTTLLLTRHVRDRGDMTVEAAVHELTGRQSDLFGIPGRGRLAPGQAGDLTVFDLDELSWEPEAAVFDFPGEALRFRRPNGGYRLTVVGGTPTHVDGKPTGASPGRWLDAG